MIDKKLFSKNRKKFFENMEKNSIAVFYSKDIITKGDGEEFFDFCEPNIYYLTGIEQPNTKLILYKSPRNVCKSLIFIDETDKEKKIWNGDKLNKKEATKISGIKDVIYNEEFKKICDNYLKSISKMYYFEMDGYGNLLFRYKRFLEIIKNNFPKVEFENSSKILIKLRSKKEKVEINEMVNAMKTTRKAFREVLRNIKKIKTEKEIEAYLSFNYVKNNCHHSYQPICASGINGCTLHYVKNNSKINRRELILIDSGAELNNYKTDVTRTYPLSGKFTKRQKEVYEACLKVQKSAIKKLRHGLDRREFEIEVRKEMGKELANLGLVKESQLKKGLKSTVKYFPHSTSHSLGLDTHDLINYEEGFKENQVVTVEPGIYIEEEKIGIRIEDNVLITKTGCTVLSKGIPKEIKDIERIACN